MSIYDLLKKKHFKEINDMIKNGEFSLDEVIDVVCDLNNNLFSAPETYYNGMTQVIQEIEGLNDSHILKIGISYKQTELESGIETITWLGIFLNTIPHVPDALVDNYAEFVLATNNTEVIAGFISSINSLPNSTNIILANGFVKMLNVYKTIDIDNIIYFIKNSWGNKISVPALFIIATHIMETNDLNKILVFANAIKSNEQLWKNLTEKHYSLMVTLNSIINSDDSIENPFAPVDDEKRMKLEGNV